LQSKDFIEVNPHFLMEQWRMVMYHPIMTRQNHMDLLYLMQQVLKIGIQLDEKKPVVTLFYLLLSI
jgi:hypothetical protein